jgi:hypothetical protein
MLCGPYNIKNTLGPREKTSLGPQKAAAEMRQPFYLIDRKISKSLN